MGIARRACLECGRIWRYPQWLPERLSWWIDRWAVAIHRHSDHHLKTVAAPLRGPRR